MAASSSQSGKRKHSVDARPPSFMMVDGPSDLLKTWWDAMPDMQRKLVTGKIGHLTDFLEIDLVSHRELVCALISRWDSARNTFRFNGFEMTPTLEELAGLVKLDLKDKSMLAPRSVGEQEFFDNIMMPIDTRVSSVKKGWIRLEYLYEHFGRPDGYQLHRGKFYQTLTYDDWSLHRARVFVLAFLGTIAFPIRRRRISILVSWVMRALFCDTRNFSIIPMILGSIYQALGRCKSGKANFFYGCNLLLQVWFMEHICDHRPRAMVECLDISYLSYHPKHVRNTSFPSSEGDWKLYLHNLSSDRILWHCSWFVTDEVLIRCRDRPFLVLMGLTGTQPYAPVRVLRQFGHIQEIPRVEDMRAYVFEFESGHFPERAQVWRLWDNRLFLQDHIMARDKLRGEVVPEYEAWYRRQPPLIVMPERSGTGTIDIKKKKELRVADITRHLEEKHRLDIDSMIAERDAARVALSESRRREDHHLQDATDARARLDRALEREVQLRKLALGRLRGLQAADQVIRAARMQVYDSAVYVAQTFMDYRNRPPEDLLAQALPFITRVAADLGGLRRTLTGNPTANQQEPQMDM